MSEFRVNGIPVEEWLKQKKEEESDEEARQIYEEQGRIPRYVRPKKTYRIQKEKNSPVRHLTEDEIRKEYGMESMGNLSNTQRIIFVLVNDTGHLNGMTTKEIFNRADISTGSTGVMTQIYDALGEYGAGIITRRDVSTTKKPVYAYAKTEKGSGLSFKEVLDLYYQHSTEVKKQKKKALGEGYAGQKMKEKIEETPKEAQEVSTTLENAVPSIPENINVNVSITCKILFGWIKGNN